MFKKTAIAVSFGILALHSFRNMNKKKVKTFKSHTIAEGETLGAIIQFYNPKLSVSDSELAELVNELRLLNPHNKTFNPGTEIAVPVFVLPDTDVAYSMLQIGFVPPVKYKSFKRLDAAVYTVKCMNPLTPVSVTYFNKKGQIVDRFNGDAGKW
jgi:hypothetical protein